VPPAPSAQLEQQFEKAAILEIKSEIEISSFFELIFRSRLIFGDWTEIGQLIISDDNSLLIFQLFILNLFPQRISEKSRDLKDL